MKTKRKIYFSVTIFLIVDFLIIFFVLKPLYQDIKEVSDKFLERRKEIVSLETKLRELKGLKKTYAEIKPDSKKIESLFVNPDKPIRFITFVERIADESGVEVNIAPGSGSKMKNENWEPVVFKIDAKGTFPSFLRFIERIEYSSWVISVNDLNVRRIKEQNQNEEGEQQQERINATFQLRTYSKEDKK